MVGPRAKAAAAKIEALRFVHSADLSPDGLRVAWCLSRIEGDEEPIDLLLSTAGSGAPAVLVATGRSTDPEFSPDGSQVAFLYRDGGNTQIAVLELASRALRTPTTLPHGVAGRPRWSPDGTRIAFTATHEPIDTSQPYRVTRAVGWLDGIGLVDDAVTDVYVLDLATLELARLTDDDSLIGSPAWHPDSERLTYVASAGRDDWRHQGRIRTVEVSGEHRVRDVAVLADVFSIAVHGQTIVATSMGSSAKGQDPYGRLFTLAEDGSRVLRSNDLDVNGDVIPDLPIPFADPQPVLLLHGDDALVRVQIADRLELHRVALTGANATRVEVATSGCVYPLAVRGDRLLYGRGDRCTAPDLWVRDLATGADAPITHTADHNRAQLTPVRVDRLTAYAVNGPPIQTTFVAPQSAVGALPTVLLIHGGPEAAFGEALFLDTQLLCEAGFGVLLVNPRGSRGYGADHQHAIRGDWGGIDADDFLAAVDLAVARGLADPDRLGVGGLSYGGFMTTWLVGHCDRFKAAVAENPVTNFVSFYGTSDVGLTFAPVIMGGPIETDFDQYVRSSPVTYAERVTTPTLLIVSDQDRRCPPEQALQFYARLRRTGCEAELFVLPGASHDGSVNGRPVVRRAQNQALVDWFATRLLGDGRA